MKKISNDTLDPRVESFIQNLRHVALSKDEAQSMRERLVAYSDLHTVPKSFSKKTTRGLQASAFYRFFSSYPRVLIASTLIILMLISGTGVSYAAEGTLPGQILYPVKVAVIEPIQGALITSTAAQAAWQSELADRRLSEASTLAAENKLATSTQQYLEQATAQHIVLAQQYVSKLANSGNDAAALQVSSSLEAHLSAHADFFALIAPRLAQSGDATTTSAVLALLQAVETDRTQIEMSQEAAEASLASTTIGNAIAINDLDATSTPSERRVIAYVEAENTNRQTEEMNLLQANSALFRLLPPGTTTASSTASTTFWMEASSTEATSSPFKELLAKHRLGHLASTSEATSSVETISAPARATPPSGDSSDPSASPFLHFLGL